MNQTLKWGAISVALILFVFFCIPVNIYKSLQYLIAIAGAAGFTYTMVKFLGSILLKKHNAIVQNPDLSDEERKAALTANNPTGCVIFPVIMALFFGFGILVLVREGMMEDAELAAHGKLTTATVVTGSAFATRSIDLTSIVLAFKKADGDSAFISHSISKAEFHNFYRHQTVAIIYSTRYPSVLKILQTPEEIRKYWGMGAHEDTVSGRGKP